jgi:hypothetical protein
VALPCSMASAEVCVSLHLTYANTIANRTKRKKENQFPEMGRKVVSSAQLRAHHINAKEPKKQNKNTHGHVKMWHDMWHDMMGVLKRTH